MPRSGLTATMVDNSIIVVGGHHDFSLHNNVFLMKTGNTTSTIMFPSSSCMNIYSVFFFFLIMLYIFVLRREANRA